MKTYKYTSEQMHCTSCSVLMEEELIKSDRVSKVLADSGKREIIVQGDFDGVTEEELAAELSLLVSEFGYVLRVAGAPRVKEEFNSREWLTSAILALAFLSFVKFLEGANFFSLAGSHGGGIPFSEVFIIGLVASVSSCLAVTGGIVLAISQSYAKAGATRIPQMMFHLGRLIGFAVLGSMLGYVGSKFTLSLTGTMVMQGILAMVMLILGLNILGVRFAQKFTPTLPKTFGASILGLGRLQYRVIPFILGAATFFLPCGFTQSMQLYALSTGSATTASEVMLTFALGTLPMLAMLSFGSRLVKKSQQGIFYKTAGLLVVGFALMSLRGLLAVAGLISIV